MTHFLKSVQNNGDREKEGSIYTSPTEITLPKSNHCFGGGGTCQEIKIQKELIAGTTRQKHHTYIIKEPPVKNVTGTYDSVS